MENKKSIALLNTLITINNCRIEGYETASKETEEQDLKVLFAKFIATSQKCKQELVSEVRKLGGEPEDGTTASGKFFRAWMDVKAALNGIDRKTISNSCEYNEDVAMDAYQSAMKNELSDITVDQRAMISAQYAMIKADSNKVKFTRDALATA